MADIKQAAKWMAEGKLVRRNFYSREISLGESGYKKLQWIRVFEDGRQRKGQDSAPMCTEDLLAEDWELSAEPEGVQKS